MSISPEEIALKFNDSINSRDLDGLARLMTDGHTFVDSEKNVERGKSGVLEAWRGFFNAFPVYQNVFERVIAIDDLVIMMGHSICPNSQYLDGPAIWTARIVGDKVSEWRVYDDTPGNRELLGV